MYTDRVDAQNRSRCSSVVECPLMVRWVVGSIPHGGPSKPFYRFSQNSVISIAHAMVRAILSVVCAYKRNLGAMEKE